MRDLTPEELKLAPDWATMYSITSNDNVRFHDEDMFCLCNGHVVSDVVSASPENFNTRLILNKPFDITKHEVANHVTVLENGELVAEGSGWIIDKDRAIAIAKALDVTGEDLT